MKKSLVSLLLIIFLIYGCAQNPVTKQTELSFVSENKEIKMGNEHYKPAQQISGGRYQADPALTTYVQSVGNKIARVSHRPDLPFEFIVLNDSTPNAWALPGGKIAVNRGLLVNLNSEAELAAVLGHEITHATARHGAKSMERATALTAGLGVLSAIIAIKTEDQTAHDVAVTGAALTAGLLTQKYGRDAEREADHYGIDYMVKAGYDPKAAVHLQETFVKLMEKKDSNWLNGLFASHPPSKERVQANRVYAQTFPQTNLLMGQDTYQNKIAHLKKVKPAYDAFDEGQKKLAKRDHQTAMVLAERAIKIEPKEALFYGLKGDALSLQKNHRAAVEWYSKAIEKDQSYYYYYLQRGLSYEKLKNDTKSKQDLHRSQSLLETDSAKQALTRLSLKSVFAG